MSWIPLGGPAASVAAGPAGTFAIHAADKTVWKVDGGTWSRVGDAAGAIHVGRSVIASMGGAIRRLGRRGWTVVHPDSPSLRKFAPTDGQIWGLTDYNQLYSPQTGVVRLPDGVLDIASTATDVYTLLYDRTVRRGPDGSVALPLGDFSRIATYNDVLYGARLNTIYRWDGTDWLPLAPNLPTAVVIGLTAGPAGVFARSVAGVWQVLDGQNTRLHSPAAHIDAGGDALLLVSELDGAVWRHEPRMWPMRPDVWGFAFVNNFRWTDAERASLHKVVAATAPAVVATLAPTLSPAWVVGDVLGALLGVPPGLAGYAGVEAVVHGIVEGAVAAEANYGLCGGMTHLAADAWNASDLPDRGTTAEPAGTGPGGALRKRIWMRLLDSLTTSGVARRTIEAMAERLLAGSNRLAERTLDELPTLLNRLDQGVWPIGIIYDTPNALDNHQMLAYGYSKTDDGVVILYVYDPNWPGCQVRLCITTVGTPTIMASHGEPLILGLFPVSYGPAAAEGGLRIKQLSASASLRAGGTPSVKYSWSWSGCSGLARVRFGVQVLPERSAAGPYTVFAAEGAIQVPLGSDGAPRPPAIGSATVRVPVPVDAPAGTLLPVVEVRAADGTAVVLPLVATDGPTKLRW